MEPASGVPPLPVTGRMSSALVPETNQTPSTTAATSQTAAVAALVALATRSSATTIRVPPRNNAIAGPTEKFGFARNLLSSTAWGRPGQEKRKRESKGGERGAHQEGAAQPPGVAHGANQEHNQPANTETHHHEDAVGGGRVGA